MSDNKQSSVEQLAELIRFTNKEVYAELFEHIEQIKAIHKEEIVKAATRWYLVGEDAISLEDAKLYGEEYYDMTFKK